MTKECKSISLGLKQSWKTYTIIHKKLSLPDYALIVLMKIKLALLHKDIANRFNVKAAKI